MAKDKGAHTREKFDLAWHAWKNESEGPKKQRLLNQIVKANYALVQKFVNRLMKHTAVHCDEDDAMQAGLIGLLTAIKKYDPKRPTRFSTMCWPWVRHEVSNMTLRQTQMYRPKGAGMPYKEHRKSESIRASTGRDPTAADLGVTPEQLEKWRSVIFHFVPMNELKEHASEDGVGVYKHSDIMRDQAPLADQQMMDVQLNRKLTRAIKMLSPIEYQILIEGQSPMSENVVEAIRHEALRRLRKTFSGL